MTNKRSNPIYEYDKVRLEELNLNSETAKTLDHFLEKNKINYALTVGQTYIRASHYVGTINFQGKNIEILPKLLKKVDEEAQSIERDKMLKNLLKMLSYTHRIKIKENEISQFNFGKHNLLEVFIYLFSKDLVNALQRETPFFYTRKEENIGFIRGKIKFNSDIKINSFNRSKTYCEFSSFERDNIYTQTFYCVAEKLLNITKLEESRQKFKHAIKLLDGVSLNQINYSMIKDKEMNKSYHYYNNVFNFCKMFLKNNSPSISSGRDNNYCVLFNMNEVFEEYVYEFINRNKDELGVKTIDYQRGRNLFNSWVDLDTNNIGGKARAVLNDIYITFSDTNLEPLIIDTKYKVIDSANDVSTNDYFQMQTYRNIEKRKVGDVYPRITLLFPQVNKPINQELTFAGVGEIKVQVRTICLWDLDRNEMINQIKKILLK